MAAAVLGRDAVENGTIRRLTKTPGHTFVRNSGVLSRIKSSDAALTFFIHCTSAARVQLVSGSRKPIVMPRRSMRKRDTRLAATSYPLR